MGSKPIIHIENGVPRHPEHRMAEPVTLDIYEGEQIAILGPNAAGKTRLVEILTGRWPLLSDGRLEYCFPDAPSQLVSDNFKILSFRDTYGDADGKYYLQLRWNQHEIDEDIPCIDGQPIVSLSSGELRKLQIRKALASHPRLLIIDNPYIGLDKQAREDFTHTLEELINQDGLQVILVVNRQKDIPSFINRIIRVKELKIIGQEDSRKPYDSNTPNFSRDEIVSFNHVTIRYGSRTILSDLSWTVHQGEHWAITGDNGSGKSTLRSLICADNPQAYACNISLFGHRRGSGESIWEIKRHIGYVSPELHRAYQKNVPAIQVVASGFFDSVGLYNRPTHEQYDSCRAWMQRFGIEHLADRNFMQLSSGEQRLCLLTRAFVKNPDLLILDEPFHGLDDTQRLRATHIIESYCSSPHITLLIVSHYADELPAGITHHLHLTRPTPI